MVNKGYFNSIHPNFGFTFYSSFLMLFCVYSLFKLILEACKNEIEECKHESPETKITLPEELCGYSASITWEPSTIITVKTDNNNLWGTISFQLNHNVLWYTLFNSEGCGFECGSFTQNKPPTEEEMVDMFSEDYEYTFQLSNPSQLTSLPLSTLILEVNGTSSQMNSLESLDFHFFPALREVVIKDCSFRNIKRLFFTSLQFLESIVIGRNCFTTTEEAISTIADRIVRISGCSALKSITVGDYSLSECCDLQIKCNPNLETIHFGSFSFFNCPYFILDGTCSFDSIIISSSFSS